MKTDNVLRMLVRACVDDQRTLRHECNFVDAGGFATLRRLVREREQFVADLEQLHVPASRRPSGSWRELLREAGRSVWVRAAGPNNGDAIGACRRSCARTAASYDRAMQSPLSDEIGRALSQHLRRLHYDTAELLRLQF